MLGGFLWGVYGLQAVEKPETQPSQSASSVSLSYNADDDQLANSGPSSDFSLFFTLELAPIEMKERERVLAGDRLESAWRIYLAAALWKALLEGLVLSPLVFLLVSVCLCHSVAVICPTLLEVPLHLHLLAYL